MSNKSISFDFINCIVCGKKIKRNIMTKVDNTTVVDEHYAPEKQMWDGGSINIMYAGYGSNWDGDSFYIGICDGCMKNNYKNGRLRYVCDTFSNKSLFSDDELRKMEEMRNRENNLNDLLGD